MYKQIFIEKRKYTLRSTVNLTTEELAIFPNKR